MIKKHFAHIEKLWTRKFETKLRNPKRPAKKTLLYCNVFAQLTFKMGHFRKKNLAGHTSKNNQNLQCTARFKKLCIVAGQYGKHAVPVSGVLPS